MSFKAVFLTLAVLAILGLGGFGGYLWYQGVIKKGLDIDLLVPQEIRSGAPFTLEVNVSNESQSILNDAELMVELPEGLVFLGSAPEKTIDNKKLGNLGEGSLTKETFELLALSEEASVKEIKATVSYLPKALGSRFERSVSADFSIVGESVALDVSMPQKVFSAEEFPVKVSYQNISGSDFKDLRLKIKYPPTFVFKSASLKPDIGNNLWELGDLRSNSEGEFTVKGQTVGPDGASYDFQTILEAEYLGRFYPIAERTAIVAIATSPLSLEISLNDSSDFVAHLGSTLSYKMHFTNNTDIGLRDVIIKAHLIGQMLNLSSLVSSAFLRASDNTLIWNTSNTPILDVLPPSASQDVSFSVNVLDKYPITRVSDKNFSIKVEAEIESPTVPGSVAASKTIGIAKHEVKVGGVIEVDTQGYFRDAAAGILNKGQLPPKVGQTTQYTIHWIVKNYATDASNVSLRAFLGGNVRMTGVTKSNTGTQPIYNDRTQEVTWTIDRIAAGKGIVNSPYEAIFQVEATPAVTQVGPNFVLIKETSIEATDDFTGEKLTDTDLQLLLSALDDKTMGQNDGVVVP